MHVSRHLGLVQILNKDTIVLIQRIQKIKKEILEIKEAQYIRLPSGEENRAKCINFKKNER